MSYCSKRSIKIVWRRVQAELMGYDFKLSSNCNKHDVFPAHIGGSC